MFAPAYLAPAYFAPRYYAPGTDTPGTDTPRYFAPAYFAPAYYAPSHYAPGTDTLVEVPSGGGGGGGGGGPRRSRVRRKYPIPFEIEALREATQRAAPVEATPKKPVFVSRAGEATPSVFADAAVTSPDAVRAFASSFIAGAERKRMSDIVSEMEALVAARESDDEQAMLIIIDMMF